VGSKVISNYLLLNTRPPADFFAFL